MDRSAAAKKAAETRRKRGGWKRKLLTGAAVTGGAVALLGGAAVASSAHQKRKQLESDRKARNYGVYQRILDTQHYERQAQHEREHYKVTPLRRHKGKKGLQPKPEEQFAETIKSSGRLKARYMPPAPKTRKKRQPKPVPRKGVRFLD